MRYGLCTLLKAVRWPIIVNIYVILVSCGELSHWQSYHFLYFFYIHHLIKQRFFYKNGNRRYKFLVLGYNNSYFAKNHAESTRKYTKDDIIKMLDFLIDNIFVEFGGFIFQQTVGIPMGTNCAPLLADLFLYSYEAEFI